MTKTMKIKIATFNVNSVKARLENVLSWLKSSNIDIALLQEIKCEEANFPSEKFFDAGYNCAVFGQKSYNGVAILSKFPIEDVTKGLAEFKEDLGVKNASRDLFDENSAPSQQARYIEAVVNVGDGAIRVASIYVPNGGGEVKEGEVLQETEKFIYKMNFFKALKAHLAKLLTYDEIAIFGGDFNVGLENIDVYDPKNLDGTVCFHSDERKKMHAILNLGLIDAFRVKNPQNAGYSWWDYRGNAWQYNKGMRIDYLLASPQAFDKVISCSVEDKGVRDLEKASDHCPVVVEVEV